MSAHLVTVRQPEAPVAVEAFSSLQASRLHGDRAIDSFHEAIKVAPHLPRDRLEQGRASWSVLLAIPNGPLFHPHEQQFDGHLGRKRPACRFSAKADERVFDFEVKLERVCPAADPSREALYDRVPANLRKQFFWRSNAGNGLAQARQRFRKSVVRIGRSERTGVDRDRHLFPLLDSELSKPSQRESSDHVTNRVFLFGRTRQLDAYRRRHFTHARSHESHDVACVYAKMVDHGDR